MEKRILIIMMFLIGCEEKNEFNVPGAGNNTSNNDTDDSSNGSNQINCPSDWENDGGIWLDPNCVAWSPMERGLTWHQAITPSEATSGGCDTTCDEEPDDNYCAELDLGGYSWALPTINEVEDLAIRQPPFEELEGDLWSTSSDSMDQMAWTANIDQPGMSVLLEKSSSADVRCIAR